MFRGYAKDNAEQFASPELFNKVFNAATDRVLINIGLLPEYPKTSTATTEEDKKGESDDDNECIDVDMKVEGLEFNEHALVTDYEHELITKFYLKESRKLK